MRITVAVVALLAALLLSTQSYAQPSFSFPSNFAGYVFINGALAPDGAAVKAQVEGQDRGAAIVTDGKYGIAVADPKANSGGRTITFLVDGVAAAETGIFARGEDLSRVEELNLTVTISAPPPQTTAPPSSGGGGGGGGGGGSFRPAAVPNTTETGCTPEWVCSEWSDCVNGLQRRVCVDIKKCGISNGMPELNQTCESGEASGAPASASESGGRLTSEVATGGKNTVQRLWSLITGRAVGGVTGTGSPAVLGALVIVVLAVVAFFQRGRISRLMNRNRNSK